MRDYLRNVPIPEPFLIALAVGLVLHFVAPSPLFPPFRAQPLVGVTLLMVALAVGWSAVSAAASVELAHPSSLITRGPYRWSRNPMYLSWTILAAGLALVLNSLWIAIAGAAAWAFLELVTIPREERSLAQAFGAGFDAYRKRVRRWL